MCVRLVLYVCMALSKRESISLCGSYLTRFAVFEALAHTPNTILHCSVSSAKSRLNIIKYKIKKKEKQKNIKCTHSIRYAHIEHSTAYSDRVNIYKWTWSIHMQRAVSARRESESNLNVVFLFFLLVFDGAGKSALIEGRRRNQSETKKTPKNRLIHKWNTTKKKILIKHIHWTLAFFVFDLLWLL